MLVISEHIHISTRGNTDIIDITPQVAEYVKSCGINNGIVTIFCPSSTSGVSTMEFEPGLQHDFQRIFDELVPEKDTYWHDEAWHDGNGHSHVQASLLKPSLTVPVADGRMTLGTWQQIVYVDFDNRPRRRELVLQIMGE